MKSIVNGLLATVAVFMALASHAATDDVSRRIWQASVDREYDAARNRRENQPVKTALAAFEDVAKAEVALERKNPTTAKNLVVQAIGKVDVVIGNHPELSLVPITTDIRILDLVTDETSVRTVADRTKELVAKGELQSARRLLQNFASEINITTKSIPIVNFSKALRSASRMIDAGKLESARAELYSALTSAVTLDNAIPLPVVKAQAFVEEVRRQELANSVNKSQANLYLAAASNQLEIAEQMGYGQRRRDFAAVQSQIEKAQTTIRRDQR
ncbi:MAG TPA: YfdX family protein, partial [Bdellovibrionales bacterium]|nr:YfdX family protein [Bdellovibrionales bacterium]